MDLNPIGDLGGRKASSSSEGAELSSKVPSLSNHRAEMMGSTDSLGRPRPPAQFIAPPPPDTPPPPETPVTALRSYHWAKDGVDVMDSSIQVHAGDSSPPVAGQHRLGKHAACARIAIATQTQIEAWTESEAWFESEA